MTKPTPTPVAKDFMTTQVQCIAPDMPLAEIIEFLERHKVSNAPVVEERDHRKLLVGFVSERDCLEFLSNESFYGSPAPPQTAATIMRRDPVCVRGDTEMFSLASIFVSHGYRHLPVVEDGELLGIVSRRDVLKAMAEHYRKSSEARDRERHPAELGEMMRTRLIVTE